MGLILNKTAILASALTAAALFFELNPLYAFLLGAIILLTPIRFAIPGEDKKIISETGIVASAGVIAAFTTLSLGLNHAVLVGIAAGYAYVFWWVFVMPKVLERK